MIAKRKYYYFAWEWALFILALPLLAFAQNQTSLMQEYDSLSIPAFRPTWVNARSQSAEPVLVILGYFPDTDRDVFTKTTQEDWTQLFFGPKPSVKNYFEQVSFQKVGLVPAADADSKPNNGVVGWYPLINNFSFYQQQYGDEYFVYMAREAVVSARNDLDFAAYDANRNGYLEPHELHIYVIVAAFDLQFGFYGPVDDPKVHRVRFPFVTSDGSRNISVIVDGVRIGVQTFGGGVCFAGELLFKYEEIFLGIRKHSQSRVAPLSHELGHDLGLPDHYKEPDNADSWCIMGSETRGLSDLDYPNAPCAPHRRQINWITTEIIGTDQSRVIGQISTSRKGLILWENGNFGQEYFHVENRYKQPPNEYDSQLTASGLLIWHVDSTRMFADITQGIALERAGHNGDAFYAGGNANFLPTGSQPDSRSNKGLITGVAISNIGAAGSIMDADLSVNHKPVSLSLTAMPQVIKADGVSTATITAKILDLWDEVLRSATNPVTFVIASGSTSGTLLGSNSANAVNGVATIQLRSTTTSGDVKIEASSPGLTSSNTSIQIFLATTPVTGPITTNTTWDLARSPFEVTGDVTVQSNATLTIEPGVVVLFKSNTQLRIGSGNNAAALIADGSQTSPIRFTSFSGDNNDWKGIVFDDGSDNGKTSSMTWCQVEKAGQPNSYGVKAEVYCFSTTMPTISSCTVGQPLSFEHSGNALYLDASSPAISHTTFYNSGGIEVVHLSRGSSPSFTNCVFTGSGSSYWIYSSHNDCNPIISSCTFNGSVNKAVRVGVYFQMSGNNFQGARSPELEIWGGQMSSSRTWRKQNGGSIYAVVGSSYHVYDGRGNLTIEPGVTVKFASGTGLLIAADAGPGNSFEGYLTAQGTSSEPIIFTSLTGADGGWQGVLFDDDSDVEGSSLMSYCVVEKAGEANRYGSIAAIYCRSTTTPIMSNIVVRNDIGPSLHLTNASLSISHSTFSHNGGSEVVLLTGSSSPSFTSCTFTGNGASYWLNSPQGDCHPNISSCTFNGSVNKAVRVGVYFQMSGNNFQGARSPELEIWGGQMSSSRTWRKQNGGSIYAVVGSSYHVYDGRGNLTIEPGVTVKFASGTGLLIAADAGPGNSFEGYLTAQGTSSEPIIFTSLTGADGGWQGVLFDDDSDVEGSSVMSYCIVEKAGQPNTYGISAAIYCRLTSTPTLNQIVIRKNSGYGLYLETSSPLLTNSDLSDNSLAAIRIAGNSHPNIANAYGASNNISGSGGQYDLENVSPNIINARYNYWGTIDPAQIAAHILDKADNPNYGQVIYEPWTDSTHVASLPDKTPPTPPNKVFAWSDSLRRVKLIEREPYSYTNPYFVWGGAKDANGIAGYAVSFTADSLANPELKITQQDSFFTARQSLRTNTKYFLKLRARDNAGNWSGSVTLFVYLYRPNSNNPPSTPVVLLPKQNEELKPEGLLIWSQSQDSDLGDVIAYTLQIDNDSTFVSPKVNHSGISNSASSNSNAKSLLNVSAENTFQVTNAVAVRLDTLRGYANLADNVIYFWRVRAYDNRGGVSQFTSGRDRFFFNKINTAPGPVTEGFSPRGGTEVRLSRPQISWFPAIDPDKSDHSGTLRYNLQLKTTADFSTAPHFSYQTKMGLNTFQITDSLDENVRWHWRVQTADDEGSTSAWSTVQNFFVNAIKEPPGQFEIQSPANNFIALGDTVIFKWQATIDPDPFDSVRYVVEWSTSRNFSSFNRRSLPANTTQYPLIRPNRADSIFWRLSAIDGDTLSTYASDSKAQPRLIRWRGTVVDTRALNVPTVFSLAQNYPNPFLSAVKSRLSENSATTIEFSLPKSESVQLRIFDVHGREVRLLLTAPMNAGEHAAQWDGRDNNGRSIGSGVYFYRLEAGSFNAMRKMLVVR